MKRAVVAFDGVVPFDLATPCETFARLRLSDGSPAYDVKVCGATEVVQTAYFSMICRYDLEHLAQADLILVPGIDDVDKPIPAALILALKAAAARGAKIASICSGAFVLAATGLLNGHRATTHWLAAAELARRFPEIVVDASVLYVDEGRLLTSAGAAAGLDLCLHLIRCDYGAAFAAQAARFSVMALERDGGQAQFIAHEPPTPEGSSLEALLHWVERHLDKDLPVSTLAKRAAMSTRTFVRRFREQTGTTPAVWLMRARVRRAQLLLETTSLSVDVVADKVGFGASSTLRERFHEVVGTSPQAYRRAFSGADARR